MPWLIRTVAAEERSEAAFGDEVVVKSDAMVCQLSPGFRVYDCCAAERSLVLLVSGYSKLRKVAHQVRWYGRLTDDAVCVNQRKRTDDLKKTTPKSTSKPKSSRKPWQKIAFNTWNIN